MKITKRGELPQPKVFKGKCPRCGTEFECNEDEIRYDAPKTYDKRTNQRIGHVICPLAGCKEVIVKTELKLVSKTYNQGCS